MHSRWCIETLEQEMFSPSFCEQNTNLLCAKASQAATAASSRWDCSLWKCRCCFRTEVGVEKINSLFQVESSSEQNNGKVSILGKKKKAMKNFHFPVLIWSEWKESSKEKSAIHSCYMAKTTKSKSWELPGQAHKLRNAISVTSCVTQAKKASPAAPVQSYNPVSGLKYIPGMENPSCAQVSCSQGYSQW